MLSLQTAMPPTAIASPKPYELPRRRLVCKDKVDDDKIDIRGQKTVLMVDDHSPLRQIMRDFLQSALPSCNFREAADGASALQACKAYRPVLVLMDKCLPDADGIELTAG